MGGRYAIMDYNEYRKKFRTNNFAESLHSELISDVLGVHPEFYEGLAALKEFSARKMLKYRRFKENGFERLRRPNERTKEVRLEKLWNLIGDGDIGLYDYMSCISMVYSGDEIGLRKNFSGLKL